ncbi:hypothetical protein AMS68_004876 [Peltaster fructicola]|uniref:Uncharacterized protein n=1 Tax=Peltaster fructicola TaxID=286661 RepID=A0A6H0XXL2_9PEZI|nr:hypothetical protein AMS68_004876 [Peltaster fructicola]
MASTEAAGPPYPPETQALGEIPSVIPDVPINAVFLALFFIGGVIHMTILQINERKYHKKFPLNGATFGFCVTRVCATSLRIAWAYDPQSVRLGLAATIFFYAGVVILFIANLFFTQRIVRAQHPNIGWSKPFSIALPIFIAVIVATILCLIAAIIAQFYSIDATTRRASRIIQLYGATWYTFCAVVPVPVVLISTIARRSTRKTKTMDKFGSGSMRAKVAISLISGVLLTLGAGYRAGTSWMPPTPILTDTTPPQPYPQPWYFGKPAYYCFDFVIEAFIVYFWIFVRIDQRFIVPNGAKGPYSYANGFIFAGETGNEKRNVLGASESQRHLTGSQSTINLQSGRASWRESRKSLASQRRVSWGGISRESVHATLGEDGIEITPYVAFGPSDGHGHTDYPLIDGVEQEMGWDEKTGKWALRPVYQPVMRYDDED